MMISMRVYAIVISLLLSTAAAAQSCPKDDPNGASQPSSMQELRGQLIYHDDLRGWFELKLDKPECGQPSIQLIKFNGLQTSLETLRGCHVRSTGTLDNSPTGYYSLDLYQDVQNIEPDQSCQRKPAFPPKPVGKPAPAIQFYRVEMDVNYRPGDHPLVFKITNGSRTLLPQQNYASYFLTGGFVLYGHCGDGFVVDTVFGTKQANPSHFTESGDSSDMAAFDPESAASAGVRDLKLIYTCKRKK